MEYYYVWFFLFAIGAYFIVTDDSAAKAVFYITKIVKNKYEIARWWIIHNPSTPWAKYFMWKRAMRIAKELQEELKNDSLQ